MPAVYRRAAASPNTLPEVMIVPVISLGIG